MLAATSRRPVAAALILALLVLVLVPGTASAHAVLLATTPGNWQVVDASPHEISLRFNEPVDVGLAEIGLLGPRGDAIEGLPRPVHPGGQRELVSVAVPSTLATGTHTVTYRVVSADSHPVRGAFSFSVGQPTPTSDAAAAPAADGGDGLTTAAYGVVRWTGYAGLAVLIGAAFLAALRRPGGEPRTGDRRLMWLGWTALASATVLGFLAYGPYAAGRPLSASGDFALLGSTLGSRMGLVLAVRLALLAAVAGWLAWWPRVPRNPWWHGGAVLGAGVALATTWSLANHSAAGEHTGFAVVADTVHLTAMSVWIGGLVALLVLLRRVDDVGGLRHAVPRFSQVAAVCVAVLVVTGTFEAWRQVGTPSALAGTTYGTILVIKLALVAVLVALGGVARRWVRRTYAEPVTTVAQRKRARRGPAEPEVRRFRRAIGFEAAVAVFVLGFTAALVSVEPAQAQVAREAAAPKIPAYTGPVNTVLPFDAGGTAGRGQLAVDISPGRIGPNEMHLTALDAQSRPREVAELRAELRLPDRAVGPLPVRVEYAGLGHYVAGASIAMPGQWELTVVVRTSEVDQATIRIPLGIR
ncbi:copper-binding protein [Amycolatopsis balhimycina DSM 5908]|uniref:Copper-binding protein n=1 Tax=Amycolatopsis balhimycina DSM 5908 TaxID=1081091 RepID=A0A428X631_AMYBA|nr:CopD family protein [Amycolatopsis balhimycina]RSM50776.1 copper-binding protein [Amycolatopsis balhimycina DSM 5908]